MSDDWQVGDLAVCVRDGPVFCRVPGYEIEHCGTLAPRRGRTVRVASIYPAVCDDGCVAECGCIVLQAEDGSAGIAKRFRKIRPDQHEPCEEEFRILLQLSKKRVKA